ncbi:hypothetical protein RJT34_26022 [Clitoria ternatea]|uniref:Uncharacterized protein n=1 Tax=Clitoria ternatea TaxID=43366 RepID=A0AAN9FBD8_CLITE
MSTFGICACKIASSDEAVPMNGGDIKSDICSSVITVGFRNQMTCQCIDLKEDYVLIATIGICTSGFYFSVPIFITHYKHCFFIIGFALLISFPSFQV